MDDERVMEPLLERFTLTVKSKRALGCASKYHAAKVRECFAQRRIYVSSADCTYWNARFLLRLVHLALRPGTFPMCQVPVLCVEGETRMPEVPLDMYHWEMRSKEPINVDMLQKATVYFLSRALANTLHFVWTTNCKPPYKRPPFTVKNSDIHHKVCHVFKMVGEEPSMSHNIYAAMSGVHEFKIMHNKLGFDANGHANTTRPLDIHWFDKVEEVDLAWRLLDDDAARDVGQRILKLDGVTALNLEGTTPCYSVCSISEYILKDWKVFRNLKDLDLCDNPLGSSWHNALHHLAHALLNGRFPELENLFLHGTGIEQKHMEELAPALGNNRQQLRCLWIGGNPIGWLGLSRLMQQSFAGSTSLEELRVEDIGCKTVHYECLAKYVKGGQVPFIKTIEIGPSYDHPRARHAINRAIECADAERQWKKFCAEECRTTPLGGFDPETGFVGWD